MSGRDWTRNQVSYAWTGRRRGNTRGRAEPTAVAKVGEDLCVGVKCQTNLEIACSPRNSFGAGVTWITGGGRALYGGGGARLTEPGQTTNTVSARVAVGPWEMSFMVERERARTCG